MTINEGLGYIKLLKQRHKELTDLRETNKNERHRMFGDKIDIEKPVYDVRSIDKKAMAVAKEIRKLDTAIKAANVVTEISYTENDDVFESI